MSKRIHKFNLEQESHQVIELPRGAEVISCAWQASIFGSGPKIWALCDGSPMEARRFYVVQTGMEAPDTGRFVGTIQRPDGVVYHVFEGEH